MIDVSLLIGFHAAVAVMLRVLGFLTLTARKSRLSNHPSLGEAYFWILAVTCSTGMMLGLVRHPGTWTVFELVTPPTFLLGLLGYVAVKRKPRGWLGRPWLQWHIAGQGGSYIGAITAAGFQVFPRFLEPSPVLTAVLWLLPTAAGSVLIARTTRRWLRKPGPRETGIPAPAA